MYIVIGGSMYIICVSIYIIYLVRGYAKFDRMYSRLATQLLAE